MLVRIGSRGSLLALAQANWLKRQSKPITQRRRSI